MDRKLSQKIKEQIANLRSQKRLQRVVGVLAVFVLCLTVCALILPAVAKVTDEAADLSAKVNSASYNKVINGEWTSTTEFLSTDQVQAQIGFTGVQPGELTNNKMCILLPDAMNLDGLYGKSYELEDTVSGYTGVPGTFTIVRDADTGKDYAVITYNQGYIDHITNKGGAISGELKFEHTWELAESETGTVDKDVTVGNSQGTVKITKVDDHEQTSNHYALNKTALRPVVDNETGDAVINYEISLTVNDNMPSPIVMDDVMDLSSNLLQYSDFTITPQDGGVAIASSDNGNGGKTLTITGTDGIPKGEYKINYAVTLKGIATKDWTATQDNAKNTITINDEGQTIQKEQVSSIIKRNVQKKGELAGSDAPYQMNWTIEVNSGEIRNKISGNETLTDVFPNELKLKDGTKVKVEVYDENNNLIRTDKVDAANNSISYTGFQSDVGKRYRYKVTYSTEVKDPGSLPLGQTTFNNHADVTDNGNPWPGGGGGDGVTVDKNGVNKEFVSRGEVTEGADGKKQMVQSWKSTIVQPVKNGDLYTDSWDGNTGWRPGYDLSMTPEQMDEVKLTAVDADGKTYNLVKGEDYNIRLAGPNEVINDGGERFMLYEISFLKEIKAPITIEYDTLCTFNSDGWHHINNYGTVRINGHYDTGKATDSIEIKKESESNQIWKGTDSATNNAPDSTVHVDGKTRTISWKILLNQGQNLFENADSVTVTDTIPEGMTYVPGSMTVKDEYNNENSDLYDENKKLLEPVFSEDGRTFSITIPKKGYQWNLSELKDFSEKIIRISYKTEVEIKEGDPSGKDGKDVTNTATLDVNGKEYSSTHTVHFKWDVIDKGGTYDKDTKRMTYDVLINADGVDLLPSGDKIEVLDQITNTGVLTKDRFALAGVSLFKAVKTAPGVYVPGEFLRELQHVESNSEGQYEKFTYTYDSTNLKLCAYLPDNEAYILRYTYRITHSLSNDVEITNTATIRGESKEISSTTNTSKIEKVSGGGSVWSDGLSIQLEKYDTEDLTKLLPGASYTLSVYDSQNKTWTAIEPTFTTQADGKITMSKKDVIVVNRVYKLEETNAPEGYLVDEKPYYFRILDGKEQVDVPDEAKNAGYTDKYYDSTQEKQPPIILPRYDKKDEKYVPKGALKVSKKWVNGLGEEITEAEALKGMPEVKVELCTEEEVSNTCTVKFWNGSSEDTARYVQVKRGGDVKWTVTKQGHNTWGDETQNPDGNTVKEPQITPSVSCEYTASSDNSTRTYTIKNITQDIVVNVDWAIQYLVFNAFASDSHIPDSHETYIAVHDTQTLNSANKWTYTWGPDQIDTSKKYFVREITDSLGEDYEVSYTRYERSNESGEWVVKETADAENVKNLQHQVPATDGGNGSWVVVKNTRKPQDGKQYTSLTLKKLWKQQTEGSTDAAVDVTTNKEGSVQFKLYRISISEDGTESEPEWIKSEANDGLFTVSKDNKWQLKIPQLLKSETVIVPDADGNPTDKTKTTTYKYYVVEEKVNGEAVPRDITISYVDEKGNPVDETHTVNTGTITTTNTVTLPPKHLLVEKKWTDKDGNPMTGNYPDTFISFRLWQVATVESDKEYKDVTAWPDFAPEQQAVPAYEPATQEQSGSQTNSNALNGSAANDLQSGSANSIASNNAANAVTDTQSGSENNIASNNAANTVSDVPQTYNINGFTSDESASTVQDISQADAGTKNANTDSLLGKMSAGFGALQVKETPQPTKAPATAAPATEAPVQEDEQTEEQSEDEQPRESEQPLYQMIDFETSDEDGTQNGLLNQNEDANGAKLEQLRINNSNDTLKNTSNVLTLGAAGENPQGVEISNPLAGQAQLRQSIAQGLFHARAAFAYDGIWEENFLVKETADGEYNGTYGLSDKYMDNAVYMKPSYTNGAAIGLWVKLPETYTQQADNVPLLAFSNTEKTVDDDACGNGVLYITTKGTIVFQQGDAAKGEGSFAVRNAMVWKSSLKGQDPVSRKGHWVFVSVAIGNDGVTVYFNGQQAATTTADEFASGKIASECFNTGFGAEGADDPAENAKLLDNFSHVFANFDDSELTSIAAAKTTKRAISSLADYEKLVFDYEDELTIMNWLTDADTKLYVGGLPEERTIADAQGAAYGDAYINGLYGGAVENADELVTANSLDGVQIDDISVAGVYGGGIRTIAANEYAKRVATGNIHEELNDAVAEKAASSEVLQTASASKKQCSAYLLKVRAGRAPIRAVTASAAQTLFSKEADSPQTFLAKRIGNDAPETIANWGTLAKINNAAGSAGTLAKIDNAAIDAGTLVKIDGSDTTAVAGLAGILAKVEEAGVIAKVEDPSKANDLGTIAKVEDQLMADIAETIAQADEADKADNIGVIAKADETDKVENAGTIAKVDEDDKAQDVGTIAKVDEDNKAEDAGTIAKADETDKAEDAGTIAKVDDIISAGVISVSGSMIAQSFAAGQVAVASAGDATLTIVAQYYGNSDPTVVTKENVDFVNANNGKKYSVGDTLTLTIMDPCGGWCDPETTGTDPKIFVELDDNKIAMFDSIITDIDTGFSWDPTHAKMRRYIYKMTLSNASSTLSVNFKGDAYMESLEITSGSTPTETTSPSPSTSVSPSPSAAPSPSASPAPSTAPSPSAVPTPSAAPSPTATPDPTNVFKRQLMNPSDPKNPNDPNDSDYGLYTLDEGNSWKAMFENLPATGKITVEDEAGNPTEVPCTFTYYVEETNTKYDVTYHYKDGSDTGSGQPVATDVPGNNNDGSVSVGVDGSITITNKTNEQDYTLPETGGAGPNRYIIGGMALVCATIMTLIYKSKKCERRGHNTL